MSWSYSPALVAAFSEACCLDTEQSAQSSMTPMPDQFYWPDKPTEHSRLSRFGMTSEPLTESRGEELLMSYLAAFRARTSAQPEPAQGSKAHAADCGAKWHGSFARYSHDSSSWKTVQCSLVEGLDEFLETWPRWGSMRNGVSYLRKIPALPIYESASGFWQTPVADDAVERKAGKWNSRGEPKLSAEVKLWPTPTVCGNYNRKGLSKTSGDGLATAVKTWPTPTASASKGTSQAALIRASGASRERDRLDHAVMASDNGQLNPDWVEWLMGWPIGHTALKPLETGRFREFVQQHSLNLQADSSAKRAA